MTQQFEQGYKLKLCAFGAESGVAPQPNSTSGLDLLRSDIPSLPKRVGLQALLGEVNSMPGHPGTTNGKTPLNVAGSISPDDILGRNSVSLGVPDVAATFADRSVLITGAGGSIGSELCRQVLSCSPRRVVLLDLSEFALYSIDRENPPPR